MSIPGLFLKRDFFVYVWFASGGLCYYLLYRDFKISFLKEWVRVLLLFFAGLITFAGLFFTLVVSRGFLLLGLFTIFCLLLMLFSSANKLADQWYWALFFILASLAFYMLTVNANCNIEYDGDVGLPNNNPLHIWNMCSTFYLWLAAGFLLAISARQKMLSS